jgi:NitT/TauT family transport system substrate-binding protein
VEPKIFPIAAEGFDPYAGLVIVQRATWRNEPAVIRSFLRAIRRGWRSYLDSPAATDAVMATLNPTMDAETFAEAGKVQRPLIETDATRVSGLGVMDKARWETLAAQLVDLGTIEKAPPIDDYWIAPASLAGP